ncbi:glycosyltransferase [Anaerobacillus isosaccharinicus]|uniref:Glycosyltransferase n=1 Tax=Anaerobacillus isosaccharinicus TaxID=1532552 RepID=A0A1S2MB82_9BACI|nr:glycosyltransferase [Anaerobacillus isosaccharinicus]MBA5587612.1 glycosyltransferase [Anaerobacillus isosaccharinicus]QOY34211.1 glycosyltransferase [Anaerobacillus isosaccharinicus]
MRIFQGTTEIAGQMGIISGELKKRGYYAVGYNTFHSYLGYKDHLINTTYHEIAKQVKHIINTFDCFHFHYASSLLLDFKDLPLIKSTGKKMIMHHWGNDVRFHEQAKVNNPYVYTGDSPSNEIIHERLTKISAHIDEAIVQDHEVLPYVEPYYKKVNVAPIAIDLDKFNPKYPDCKKNVPLILHAPTNPEFKGTKYIEAAIKELANTHTFEYKRLEKLSNAEIIKIYRDADIIADQILCGSYGLLSVESMALGKPVITFIRPDIANTFPSGLPIVNANPDTVYEKLKLLIEQPSLRKELGMLGRKYVENYHSKEIVTDKLIQIYTN